jgi:hypothetical protein
LAATVGDDITGPYFSFFNANRLVVAHHGPFWDSKCALGRIFFDPRVGTFDLRNVYLEEGRTAVAYASLAQ